MLFLLPPPLAILKYSTIRPWHRLKNPGLGPLLASRKDSEVKTSSSWRSRSDGSWPNFLMIFQWFWCCLSDSWCFLLSVFNFCGQILMIFGCLLMIFADCACFFDFFGWFLDDCWMILDEFLADCWWALIDVFDDSLIIFCTSLFFEVSFLWLCWDCSSSSSLRWTKYNKIILVV